jgi:tripartite-type tricarboxylate transporter receptor subunit TctC
MRAFVQRRELLLGLAALPVAARIAVAETYPSRAVRILVATSAGGGTDLVARFIAQWLTERLGQSFFVENRPGGGNNIGTEMAARSPADGYALFMANTVNTINNSLYRKLNYNFIADFAPVANVMGTPLLVLVRPSLAAKNAAELIALAKTNPGKLNLASGGVGSTGHMSAELFQMMAGIKFTHVPYRGEAPALTDLIAGQAELMVSTTGSCSTPGPARCARSRQRPTTVSPSCPMCRRCRRRCRATEPTPGAASARRKERLRRSSPCSTRR